jgi:tRNA-specific 2-thiouridylase
MGGGVVRIVFDEPQKTAAAGQALVLYDGETVLGGGTIMQTGGRAK